MSYTQGWHDVRQKLSGKWEARWADEAGKARGKCFLTKAQAQKYAWDMANGILNAAVGLAPAQKDIQEALNEFLNRRIKPQSLSLYQRYIEEFFRLFPGLGVLGVGSGIGGSEFSELTLGRVERKHIIEYDRWMELRGRNPGGRSHALRPLRSFFRFCMERGWLGRTPFLGFKLPTSTFKSRSLTPEEFDRLISVDPRPRYSGVDQDLNHALRLGRLTMLRRSQIWKLTPQDFRAPDQLWVEGIKKQEGVWITLLPEAVAIIKSRIAERKPTQRLFDRWKSADAMKQSVHDKACRVGLKGVRFHDAGKVTRVTELDAAGFGIGEISILSNTTPATLARFYIQSNRQRTFEKYKRMYSDLSQTYRGPKLAPKPAESIRRYPIDATESNIENSRYNDSIVNSRRDDMELENFWAHSSIDSEEW